MIEPQQSMGNDGRKKRNLFCVSCAGLRPPAGFIPILTVLIFLGTLLWARQQDPYLRQWFTLKTADRISFKGVAVLPKPARQYPVVIYAHGASGTLMNDGYVMRQMAELGLAVVSLEYNQTNGLIFGTQFEALLHYLRQQRWVNTNAIAWVGSSLGANRMFDFAREHPGQQPHLLVLSGGSGMDQSTNSPQPSTNLHCPILLVHGERDEVFPVADTTRLASVLRTNGLAVDIQLIPGAPHNMQPDRGVVFRGIGEYCLTHLAGKKAWQDYNSVAQREAAAPPFWLFWLPAAAWAAYWFVWSRLHKPVPSEPIKLQRHEIALRWLAVVLAIWALTETTTHLATPRFSVSDRSLIIARRFLVQPKEFADFECLAAQPIWQTRKLRTLLEHARLAGYNRELINWRLDDQRYRDFVLSPVITGKADEQLNWRRPLWEEFYPRIRRVSSPEEAARMVVRHLRERVTIASMPGLSRDVPAIWLKQITDEVGFENIYIAALRSVGVPARLDSNNHAEFWDGSRWQAAPRPVIANTPQIQQVILRLCRRTRKV